MNYIEFFFIAATLSFDTFAVSLAGGLTLVSASAAGKARIILSFALMQSSFFAAGWYTASLFAHVIAAWDHWIAFSILLLLGIKIIADSIKSAKCGQERKNINLLNGRQLLLLSMATSIDALVAGIAMALLPLTIIPVESQLLNMLVAVVVIALVTLVSSLTGLYLGRRSRGRLGERAELIGGVILILIGVKVLVEHLA